MTACETGAGAADSTSLNAAPTTAAGMLSLVRDVGNSDQILSGQESMYWDQYGNLFPSTRDAYVDSQVGDYPAVFATDFGDFHGKDTNRRAEIVPMIKEYAAQGSMVALSYHICPPSVNDGCGFEGVKSGNYPSSNIDQILTPGTDLNRIHMERLAEVGDYLEELKNAGIPVMWRPFHEMNGSWFWWGKQNRYVELYRQMHDYYTGRGLNNLVWVFSVNYWGPNEESPAKYYPGDRYVDVLGADIYERYGHRFEKRIHDDLLAIGGGKPIGITENGRIPNWPQLVNEQPKWAFFMTWFGFEENSRDLYPDVFSDDRVLTQKDLGSGGKARRVSRVDSAPVTPQSSSSAPVSPSNSPAPSNTSGCVDRNNDQNGWGFDSNGQSCEIDECFDIDGDGWGWNQARKESCRI